MKPTKFLSEVCQLLRMWQLAPDSQQAEESVRDRAARSPLPGGAVVQRIQCDLLPGAAPGVDPCSDPAAGQPSR